VFSLERSSPLRYVVLVVEKVLNHLLSWRGQLGLEKVLNHLLSEMRLLLTKVENIALTIIITIRLIIYPLCLLSLVRLGGYIVNLCDFYFCKLIGKLTAFLQLQTACAIYQCPVPLPPRGVLLPA
jgi:hypothetical protein